ncbi:hypothetical protein C8Q74DRAFT_3680 [Fomes fomentarius]|nr:hypothetical protein C8Q74DRAFT_3680 [Fomes fomentarius]
MIVREPRDERGEPSDAKLNAHCDHIEPCSTAELLSETGSVRRWRSRHPTSHAPPESTSHTSTMLRTVIVLSIEVVGVDRLRDGHAPDPRLKTPTPAPRYGQPDTGVPGASTRDFCGEANVRRDVCLCPSPRLAFGLTSL